MLDSDVAVVIAGVEVRTSKVGVLVVALWRAGSSFAHSLYRFLKIATVGSDCWCSSSAALKAARLWARRNASLISALSLGFAMLDRVVFMYAGSVGCPISVACCKRSY